MSLQSLFRITRGILLVSLLAVFIGESALSAARRRRARAKAKKVEQPAEKETEESAPAAPAVKAAAPAAVTVAPAAANEIIPGSGTNVVAESETPGAQAKSAPSFLITGFVDMGFSFAQNKGVGYKKDVGNNFQQFADKTAVFVGDPASTYMNTRHEAHDFGEASNFPLMFDMMQGKGNPMGTINSATIDMIAEIHEKVRLQVSTEFLPRAPVVQNQTGLGSFVNLFCHGRSIGAYRTPQSRSYFALRLPGNWWLVGVDSQLHADLDPFGVSAAVAVEGSETLDLSHAPVWGLVRAAQAEYADRALMLVDVDDEASSRASLEQALSSDEPQVAVRAGRVLMPRLVVASSGELPATIRLPVPLS